MTQPTAQLTLAIDRYPLLGPPPSQRLRHALFRLISWPRTPFTKQSLSAQPQLQSPMGRQLGWPPPAAEPLPLTQEAEHERDRLSW